MPHTPFLVAAYALTLVALIAMIGLSLRRMRRAEQALEKDR